MDELFTVSGENKGNAFLHILIELYAQNSVMTEMMAKVYATQTNQDLAEVHKSCQESFLVQKKRFQSHIQLFFGDINLNDILPPE